jgi:hypothetical protein
MMNSMTDNVFRVLVIPNSVYSVLTIVEYIKDIEKLRSSLSISVDILFVKTTNNFVREMITTLLEENSSINLNILGEEIDTIKITKLNTTRSYREKFYRENKQKISQKIYDEILLSNIYLLGIARRIHGRKKITLISHGLSDLLRNEKTLKSNLIKLYGEIEQLLFVFGINKIFGMNEIKLGGSYSESKKYALKYLSEKSKHLREEPLTIILLPHIFTITKRNYAEKIVDYLTELKISETNIYCKSHPALNEEKEIYANRSIIELLNEIDKNDNIYNYIDSKDNIEHYLSENTKTIIGEISTSLLTAKYLNPRVHIIVMNFNHLFQKSLNKLADENRLDGAQIKELYKILFEFELLYKRFKKVKAGQGVKAKEFFTWKYDG